MNRIISVSIWVAFLTTSIFAFQNCGGRQPGFSELTSGKIKLADTGGDETTQSEEEKAPEEVAEEEVLEKMECPDDPTKECVMICHVPPGNPSAAKTQILPLKAVDAHMHHGSEDESDDYYGACRS